MNHNPPPTITTLASLQQAQAAFCALNNFDNTIEETWSMLQTEIEECRVAIAEETVSDIKSELADMLIYIATLANLMQITLATPHPRSAQQPIATLQQARKEELNRARKGKDMLITLLHHIALLHYRSVHKEQLTKKNYSRLFADMIVAIMDIANNDAIPLEQALTQKLARNYVKYNPTKRKALLASGISPEKAYNIQKHHWDKRRDKQFVR